MGERKPGREDVALKQLKTVVKVARIGLKKKIVLSEMWKVESSGWRSCRIAPG